MIVISAMMKISLMNLTVNSIDGSTWSKSECLSVDTITVFACTHTHAHAHTETKHPHIHTQTLTHTQTHTHTHTLTLHDIEDGTV